MKFLIWCHRRQMWWLPNERGYTADRRGAGRYTYEDALRIVSQANFYAQQNPEETMCPDC